MPELPLNSDCYTKAAVIFTGTLTSGFFMGGGLDKPLRTAGGNYSVNLSPRGYILLMLLQLLAAITTYAFSYDPTNTYKPETDKPTRMSGNPMGPFGPCKIIERASGSVRPPGVSSGTSKQQILLNWGRDLKLNESMICTGLKPGILSIYKMYID